MLKTTAIIPAREGSKGLPGKNIKPLLGRPLLEWSILRALESNLVDKVIVSTDSEQIAEIASRTGATVPGLRPKHLAHDGTSTEDVLIHAVENWCNPAAGDLILLLQPTSPVRLPHSIDEAINLLRKEDADSLVSVCPSHSFFWRNWNTPVALYNYKRRPRRQDIPAEEINYRENGSIYLTKASVLLTERNRLGGKIVMYVMKEIESWEIDSQIDFVIVESLMQGVIYGHR